MIKVYMASITVEDYTTKSFVVRGDTVQYKENMKALGGKWNASLTDKTSGEKFGGWIFPSTKKTEFMEWFDNKEDLPVITKPVYQTNDDKYAKLEAKVDKLIEMVSQLTVKPKETSKTKTSIPKPVEETSFEDEYDEVPIKRLLRK
jgi:hypothetical protein